MSLQIKGLLSHKNKYHYLLWLAPIFFGFWSIVLGQDRSFDLASYHIYNGFSFLYHKFDIDFSVALTQTYYNPILDVPLYIFHLFLNPKYIAFFYGALHGLNFILVYKISSFLLSRNVSHVSNKIILLISVAGSLTPSFLSGIGNSMGDNTTAFICLSSLYVLLKYWPFFRLKVGKYYFFLILSGLLMGLAVGTKLTNAPFGLALCLSFLAYPTKNLAEKFKLILILSSASFIGLLITGGFWFLNLWEHFHNPFFPMFSNIFKGTLSSIDNVNNAWIPKTIIDALFFPLFKSIGFHQVSDSQSRQLFWPILYLLLLVKIFLKFKPLRFFNNYSFSSDQLFLLWFISISYIAWMFLFGIQRYLVAIEMLTPLAIFILFNLIKFDHKKRYKVFKYLCFGSSLLTIFGGFGGWGHTQFTNPTFKVDRPIIANPENALVLMTDKSPIAWLVTQFPKDLAFFRLNAFDHTDEILERYMKNKSGQMYAIFSGHYNWRVDNVKRWDGILTNLHLKNSLASCKRLNDFIEKVKFRGKVIFEEKDNEFCYVDLKPQDVIDANQANTELIFINNENLSKHGLSLSINTCNTYAASIGMQHWSYIWCDVSKTK